MQTIFKQTGLYHHATSIWSSQIIAKFRDAPEIPTGYQDEAGFHFGIEPVSRGALRRLDFNQENKIQ